MSVIWSLHFGRLGASVEDVSLANLRGLHADRRGRRSGKRRTPITLSRSQIGLVLLNLAQVILDWVLQSLEPVLGSAPACSGVHPKVSGGCTGGVRLTLGQKVRPAA